MNCQAQANTMKKPSLSVAPLPNPEKDGVDHINVHYNLSKTKLGRQLATYYTARFEHPFFGPFKCIEGFRYYLLTGCRDDEFRGMTGSQARQHYHVQSGAGKLKKVDLSNLDHILLLAYYHQLSQHPVIAANFIESTLPFDNYYLHGDEKLPIEQKLPIRPPIESAMLTNTLTTLRELMRQGKAPPDIPREEYAKLIDRKPT